MLDNLKNEDGFTLLEVLVSFVILSLSLGVIYQLIGSGTLATTSARNQEIAILIAQSKMSESVLYPGVRDGVNGKYRWNSVVTNLNEGKNTSLRLLNIYVVVTWNEFSGEKQISFETQKLLPGLN